MGRPVAIVGVGQTKHGDRTEITYPDLVREAVNAAYLDAKIDPDDVDGVIHGSMPSMMEGVAMNHFYFADAMKAKGKQFIRTETCGTTGMSLAITGYYWITSGFADLVVVVGSEKMMEGDGQATMVSIAEPFYMKYFASGAPGAYAMLAQEWMNRYDIPDNMVREAASMISINHHENALSNPYAHIKQSVTEEETNKAPVIVYPIRLWDVCPLSDGACAIIMASEEVAKKLPNKPAWIKAASFIGNEATIGDADRIYAPTQIKASRDAYKMAGIKNPLEELDVAETYNPFTFMELKTFEAFGFCEPGKACEETLKGTFTKGGKLPCAPSGGVLCTNPIGAAALIRVAEIALQVTDRAGEMQIEGAKTGLASGLGGCNQFVNVMILGDKL